MDILTINDQPGAHAPSYYAASAPTPPDRPIADGVVECDVCVVGGGFAGLSAALHLAEGGAAVALIEANRVGWGASGRNGGQAGVGQRIPPHEMARMIGRDGARALWELGLDAARLVKRLIAERGLDCDWRDGILYAEWNARDVPPLFAEIDGLARDYGYDAITQVPREEMPRYLASECYAGGVLMRDAGHLHPLKYAMGLATAAEAAGARIFERSRVVGMDLDAATPTVRTERAEIRAARVVLALNGYHGDLDRRLSAHVMPINNFIVATEPLGPEGAAALIPCGAAVADSKYVVNYFRLSADHRLLFGGGESYGYAFPRDLKGLVRRSMIEVFPQLAEARLDYAWGGTLGITRSRLPFFQRDRATLRIGGFSGHGVSLATLAGKLAADAVRGDSRAFDCFAEAPTPPFPGGPLLRWPLLVAAMSWYALRDRL